MKKKKGFNSAAAVNRGVTGVGQGELTEVRRFNSAAAVNRGVIRGATIVQPEDDGFNSAAAVNRGVIRSEEGANVMSMASIRPRR